MSDRRGAVWPPYIWTALALALTSGFGLGGALFAARAFGWPPDRWWPALAQAHGHSQLFGFAGLLALGTLLHFFPRLRGAPLARPALTRPALLLYGGGLALRIVAQPAVALRASSGGGWGWRFLLASAGASELVGGSLALALLTVTLRAGPPLPGRAALRAVLPFLAVAAGGFWLALGVNAIGLGVAAWTGTGLVPPLADWLAVELGLYALLLPVAVAMSARLFPLYFRTPLPRNGLARAALVTVLLGLVLRAAGEASGGTVVAAVGQVAQGVALLLFFAALGVVARRRPVPQPVPPLWREPIWLHALAAYLWLALAGVVLLVSGLAGVGLPVGPASVDVERHLLGSGYVTLLILGIGARLLPGFARRPLRSVALVWATLLLGNLATLLRTGPFLLPLSWSATAVTVVPAIAGLAGVVAIGLFAFNLTGTPGSRPAHTRPTGQSAATSRSMR